MNMPVTTNQYQVTQNEVLAALVHPSTRELLSSACYQEPISGGSFTIHSRPGSGIEIIFGRYYHAFDIFGNYQSKHPDSCIKNARVVMVAICPSNFISGTPVWPDS